MDEPKPRRGWPTLYALAFALMIVSGVLVVVGGLQRLDEQSLRLLRISYGFSVAAIVVAVASVLVSRRG